jgi:hypothetical protein
VQIDARVELPAGSEEETEIRAASVQAVELMRESIRQVHGERLCPASIQLDWWLWAAGERTRASDPCHHRTRTIFY